MGEGRGQVQFHLQSTILMHASVAYVQVTTEKHAATSHPATPIYAVLPSGLRREV
jgi:hypothetical protein